MGWGLMKSKLGCGGWSKTLIELGDNQGSIKNPVGVGLWLFGMLKLFGAKALTSIVTIISGLKYTVGGGGGGKDEENELKLWWIWFS